MTRRRRRKTEKKEKEWIDWGTLEEGFGGRHSIPPLSVSSSSSVRFLGYAGVLGLVGLWILGFLFHYQHDIQRIQLEKQLLPPLAPSSSSSSSEENDCLSSLLEQSHWTDRLRYRLWEDDRLDVCLRYYQLLHQSDYPNPLTVIWNHMMPSFGLRDQLTIGFIGMGAFWIYRRTCTGGRDRGIIGPKF